MSQLFVNIGMTLDGYMAPEGMTMGNPAYKDWGAKWGALMGWVMSQQHFRQNLKLGPGVETGPINDLLRSTIVAGQEPLRIFEMDLKRLGDTDWPAGGAVGPR